MGRTHCKSGYGHPVSPLEMGRLGKAVLARKMGVCHRDIIDLA
jgi:hypothetical protein